MFRLALLTLAAAVLAAGTASAETVTAVDDAYVRGDNAGPYGTLEHVYVTGGDTRKERRKGFLSFVGVDTNSVVDASLSLQVSVYDSTVASTSFYVFGVRDRSIDGTCKEVFDEATLKNDHVGWLDTSEWGVDHTSNCVFEKRPLGTFSVKSTDLGKVVTFKNNAMLRFLKENSDSRVTFLLTRMGESSFHVAFAAQEHPTMAPARFWFTRSDVLSTGAGTTLTPPAGGGEISYSGDLRLPVSGGAYVTLPAVSAKLTFSSTGRLLTANGKVGGAPVLPGGGLLARLGGLETSAPEMEFGYDYPANFDTLGLPLVATTRYFFFRFSQGTSVSLGAVTASMPGLDGEGFFALDPVAPAIFLYTDQLPGVIPLDSVALGVSAADTIPYVPLRTEGVENYLVPFNGDLYLGAAMSLDTGIDGVSLDIAGDMTVNVNDDQFAVGRPQDWINALGTNASLGVSAEVGVFSASQTLAETSLLYRRYGQAWLPSLTFVGVADTLDANVPFIPEGSVRVSGYLSPANSGLDSFLELEGRLKFGASFAKQSLDLKARLSGSEGTISGKARFVGVTMDVSGTVTPTSAYFKGSVSTSWKADGGSISAKVKGEFNTKNIEVALGAEAKACLAGVCQSAGIKEVRLKDDGHIRLCVDTFFAGTQCTTL